MTLSLTNFSTGDTNYVATLNANNAALLSEISSTIEPTLNTAEQTVHKNALNGYAGLDSSGKIPLSILPTWVANPATTGRMPAVRALATSNLTLSGLQTVDGVSLAAGDVALAIGQSTGSQNGPWVVSAGAWTRPSYWVSGAVSEGFPFFVAEGTTNKYTGYLLSTSGTIVVDTTSVAFTQFTGLGDIAVSAELTKTGNTLSVTAGGITNAMLVNNSVTLAGPAEFAGWGAVALGATLTLTKATQAANTGYFGPTTGSAAQPTFRALVAADLPSTAVSAGSYTKASITVDAQGRLTAASSGTIASADLPATLSNTTAITPTGSLTLTPTGALTLTGGAASTWSLATAGNDTLGFALTINSGKGGPASATGGGNSGNLILQPAAGGNGTGALNPGNGGATTVAGGAAGTGGTSNAGGGNLFLRGGSKSGTGANGSISIGDSNTATVTVDSNTGNVNIGTANAGYVNLGKATGNVYITGKFSNNTSANEFTTASAGSNGALPATVQGYFLYVDAAGNNRKIPYYAT